MKKVLMLSSVASMIEQFNMRNLELLHSIGFSVDVACNFDKENTISLERIKRFKRDLDALSIKYYQVDFARNAFNLWQNKKSYKQLEKIFKQNVYEFVHCHSPIGGLWGRILACRYDTKAIYTAHGFHFYKGAPLINWLIYYPIERVMASCTDVLITINKEDYNRAKEFKAKKVEYVPGVGVAVEKFANHTVDKEAIRKALSVPADAFVLLSVGELNKNKNHQVIIRALAKLNNNNAHYIIAGRGALENEIKALTTSLKVEKQVHLLGYRTDIADLYKMSDVFCFPSKREGLSVALMEAMASGLPCIVSDIRGNTDLAENGKGAYMVKPTDIDGFSEKIKKLLDDADLRNEFGLINTNTVKRFESRHVMMYMKKIYEDRII